MFYSGDEYLMLSIDYASSFFEDRFKACLLESMSARARYLVNTFES